jgi:DUF4097 and DUF4098 domain-containing protein YvlB
MLKRLIPLVLIAGLVLIAAPAMAQVARQATREFPASDGQKLVLDLETGGAVEIRGWSRSGINVAYMLGGRSGEDCVVDFKETEDGLTIRSRYEGPDRSHSTKIEFVIDVPQYFDIELDSMGGGLTLTGVNGTFSGKTMGGALILSNVRGEARLTTMGGEIRLTDSELDGSLKTMGGEVLFENVIGDVTGKSMGGNVRYKNVQRRSGDLASPVSVESDAEITPDTVQISTMGGAIEVEDAPEGATLHTMGGDIRVTDARRFVSAKTMGGDVRIDSVDGWVKATTMGGDIEVAVVGSGGDVVLTSMSGEIELVVPSGFSMELDLEIAYTKNSGQDYAITTDFGLQELRTREWDHEHGSPRKYIRANGTVSGGQNRVKIRTINGNIRVVTGR